MIQNKKVTLKDKTSFVSCLYAASMFIPYVFYNTKLQFQGILQTVFTVFSIVLFFLWVCINKKWRVRSLIICFVFLTIGLISYYITRTTVFLLILLGIIIFDYSDRIILIRVFAYIRFCSLCLLFILAILGLIPNELIDVYKSGTIISTHTYGFMHSNQLGQAIGSLIMAIMYLSHVGKKKKDNYLLWVLLIALCYALTKSRTALVCSSILLLIILISNNVKWKKRLEIVLQKGIIPIMGIIIFVGIGCPYLMSVVTGRVKILLYAINGFLGSRFSFANAVIRNYDVKLFGNVFDFSYLETLYGAYAVDDSYINLVYNFGLIAFVLFVLLSIISVKEMTKYGDYTLAACVLIFAIWGVTENVLFNPGVNFCLVVLGMAIRSKSTRKEMIVRRYKNESVISINRM